MPICLATYDEATYDEATYEEAKRDEAMGSSRLPNTDLSETALRRYCPARKYRPHELVPWEKRWRPQKKGTDNVPFVRLRF